MTENNAAPFVVAVDADPGPVPAEVVPCPMLGCTGVLYVEWQMTYQLSAGDLEQTDVAPAPDWASSSTYEVDCTRGHVLVVPPEGDDPVELDQAAMVQLAALVDALAYVTGGDRHYRTARVPGEHVARMLETGPTRADLDRLGVRPAAPLPPPWCGRDCGCAPLDCKAATAPEADPLRVHKVAPWPTRVLPCCGRLPGLGTTVAVDDADVTCPGRTS